MRAALLLACSVLCCALVWTPCAASAQDGSAEAPKATPPPPEAPSPWAFEGIIGLPFDGAGALTLNGYADIGYSTGTWGGYLYAEYDSYDEGTETEYSYIANAELELSGFYIFGKPGDPLRGMVEVGFEYNSQDTEYRSPDTGTSGEFSEYGIIYAMGGVQQQVSDRFAYQAIVGFGVMQEYYEARLDSDELDLAGEVDPGIYPFYGAKAGMLYKLFPDTLHLRSKLDLEVYTVHHISLLYDPDIDLAEQQDQIELDAEEVTKYNTVLIGFLDITWLSFYGISPNVYGSMESYYEEAETATDEDVIFEFGVGLGTSTL